MSIFDIKFQDRPIGIFQQARAGNRLSHAYIFAGPSGIGKYTTARELSKLLLCEKPVTSEKNVSWSDSCGTCVSCRLLESGNHPDFHPVYKELISLVSGKENHKATELGIDVIRQEVIEKVARTPTVSRSKIFIILEAELMNRSSQNALLKTLEEPPADTFLFLICGRMGTLLPTIRSRSQTLIFSPLDRTFVVSKLKQEGASEKSAEFLSDFVGGKLGLALQLYRLGVYDLKEKVGKDLAAMEPLTADDIAQWSIEQSQELAQKLISQTAETEFTVKVSESEFSRKGLKLIFSLVGGFLSDALRMKVGLDETSIMNRDQISVVTSLMQRNTPVSLSEKIKFLAEAEKMIDANANQNLVAVNGMYAVAGG